MSVVAFNPRQQKRSLVITQSGDKWRVSIIPPAPECEPEIPQSDLFDDPDKALGYAARLSARFGWNLDDYTGRRSATELHAAIIIARDLEFRDEGPEAA